MKRLTTDNPQGNVQAALNLFYIKDGCETWVRSGGSGPEYPDVSLCDYIRQMIKVHMPDAEADISDDDLSMMMTEWLLDGPETMEGVIATLFTAAWAFSELRYKLAAYEDIGFEPEDFKKAFDEVSILKLAGNCLGTTADHLRELVQAEQDGRLAVLPCKVGDTVWFIKSNFLMAKFPIEAKHVSIRGIDCDGDVLYAAIITYNQISRRFKGSDIGKTVFLTREEAKAALEGVEET